MPRPTMWEALEQAQRFAESPTGQMLREQVKQSVESPIGQKLREQLQETERWAESPSGQRLREQVQGAKRWAESPSWREISEQMRTLWLQEIDAEIEAKAVAAKAGAEAPRKRKAGGGRRSKLTPEQIEKGKRWLSGHPKIVGKRAYDKLREELKLKVGDASDGALYRTIIHVVRPGDSK
jgi:hypothetical protein